MLKKTWICDRCGQQINGVVYNLTCYAQTRREPEDTPMEAIDQNIRQNALLVTGSKDLCQKCKDELTDGLFIV